MTDHLAKALQVLEPMAHTPVKGAIRHIVEHLRPTPTAPARTERGHVVDVFSEEFRCTVRDCLGCGALVPGGPTRCGRCATQQPPPEAEENETTQRGTMVLPAKRRVLWESGPVPIGEADTEGSEGPGEELLELVTPHFLASKQHAFSHVGPRTWATGLLDQLKTAGYVVSRSSAARELAEKYSSQDPLLVHEGTIECNHCCERSKAYGGTADSATICPVRARALTGELAELREKVKAYEASEAPHQAITSSPDDELPGAWVCEAESTDPNDPGWFATNLPSEELGDDRVSASSVRLPTPREDTSLGYRYRVVKYVREAELREKLKAWEPVITAALDGSGNSVSWRAGVHGKARAIPAHLRPGSGSGEGKA